MVFKELNERLNIENEKKIGNRFADVEKLINELKKKEIPLEIIDSINLYIDEINSFSGSNENLSKQLKKVQCVILKLIEKELKLVRKNHYLTMWLAIGMAAFGIPFGVAFGVSLGNMAFLGIGLPLGMSVGIAIGAAMDKKAAEKGKQLDLEIKL
jgi:hypothetical protein